jgi:hypothetical protein
MVLALDQCQRFDTGPVKIFVNSWPLIRVISLRSSSPGQASFHAPRLGSTKFFDIRGKVNEETTCTYTINGFPGPFSLDGGGEGGGSINIFGDRDCKKLRSAAGTNSTGTAKSLPCSGPFRNANTNRASGKTCVQGDLSSQISAEWHDTNEVNQPCPDSLSLSLKPRAGRPGEYLRTCRLYFS